jgi:MAX-like protein X
LQQIVPSLRETKNGKASKAAMLQKTAEYIHTLKSSQSELTKDLNDYKSEIELLSDQISDLQNELPENGVSMLGNVNKTEQFRQKYNAYVQERTVENWKFYVFSMIMKPLFENYVDNVNTTSKEDLDRSVMEWQSRFCNLTQLRPRKLLLGL